MTPYEKLQTYPGSTEYKETWWTVLATAIHSDDDSIEPTDCRYPLFYRYPSRHPFSIIQNQSSMADEICHYTGNPSCKEIATKY